MPVILDHQHRGKPHKPNDRGAAVDLDGDGTIEPSEMETHLVESYIAAATADLVAIGEVAILIADGAYRDRHLQAIALAEHLREHLYPLHRTAYIACHLNASDAESADYGGIFYDAQSKGGEELADALGERLVGVVGSVSTFSSRPRDWTRNAYSTIAGIYAGPSFISGVCFEPAFLTAPTHRHLLTPEGLQQIGEALALGASDFTTRRTS